MSRSVLYAQTHRFILLQQPVWGDASNSRCIEKAYKNK